MLFQASDAPGECQGFTVATERLPSDFEFPDSGQVFVHLVDVNFCAHHFFEVVDCHLPASLGVPPARFGVALVHSSRQECGSSSYELSL